MSQDCVVAVYDKLSSAKDAVHALANSGFPTELVSLATTTLKEDKEVREAIDFGDETERDAALGAGVGGALGLLAGASVMTVAGFGTIVLAGPIIAAGIVGALLGAMTGWGVHTDHIGAYEKKLKEGKVLVIAHGNPMQVADAKRVLINTHTAELHLHAKTDADTPGIMD